MKSKCLESKKLSFVLFLTLFILHTVVYMTKNMFSAAMASIVEAGVMSKSQTGSISAVFWFVYAASQVVGGFAADKYSPFKMICIGIISGIVSNFIIYLCPNYTVIMVVWSINAALQFGLWPGLFKIVTTQITPSFRSTAIFWVLLSTSAGQAISLLVASVVTNWLDNFLVSAISLLVLLVAWIGIYGSLSGKMVESEPVQASGNQKNKSAVGMKVLFKKSGLIYVIAISLLITMVSTALKTLTPVMLMESYAALPAAIANRMSVLLIVFAVGGMFLANGFRRKVTGHEMKGIAFFAATALPFMFLTYNVGTWGPWVILILLSASIVFLQAASPFANSFSAARFTPYSRSGTASGLLNASAAMGNVFASYVFPLMAEYMPWRNVVLTWGGSGVVIVLIALLMVRKWTTFIGEA